MTDQADGTSGQSPSILSDRRPVLPGYDIRQKLGENRDSVTWKSVQVSLDRAVVIKVLKPVLMQDAARVERFIEQTRAVARLKHPAVIQVYDVAQQGGACYVVTEYIDGETLEASLQRLGRQAMPAVLYTMRSIGELLDEAASVLGIAHGALHPGNIMLNRDGSVKLADLGMTGVGHASQSEARDPCYQAPERDAPGATPTVQGDMYALGAVMYHMMTGRKPFDGMTRDAASGEYRRGALNSPRDIDPSLPAGAVQLLRRLMMKAPEERYPTWTKMLADLHKVESGKVLVVKSRQASEHGMAAVRADVAAPAGTTGAERAAGMAAAPLRLRSRAAETPTAGLPVRRRYAGLRVLLWFVLFGWWGGLTWHLLELPPRPDLHRPPAPLPRAAAPAVPVPPPSGVRSIPTIPDVPPPPGLRPERRPDADMRPEFPERAMPGPDRLGRAELGPIAEALLDENPQRARQHLQQLQNRYTAEAVPPVLAELDRIMAAVEGVDQALLEAFQRQRGQRMQLQYGGRSQPLVVRSAEGGAIEADIVSGRADVPTFTPVRIPLAMIPPQERARLLGNPETPAAATVHFLLHMDAADYRRARELAGACGPLAELFGEAVQARIRVLMQ